MSSDSIRSRATIACAAGLLLTVAAGARAGTYVEDFSDGVANQFSLNGMQGDPPNRVFMPAEVSSGSLRLTGALNSWQATAILADLDPGFAVPRFTASFSLAIGPGTAPPADGLSFNFGQLSNTSDFGEEGPGGFNGLTIAADVYDNGGGEAPAVDVKVNDAVVAGGHLATNPYTNGAFVPVTVNLDADGTLDLTVAGNALFSNLQTGFVPEAGDRFGWGARTGGLNAETRIDDININTDAVPEPAAIGVLGLGSFGLLVRRRRRA